MDTHDALPRSECFNDALFAVANLEHKHLTVERELVPLKWYGYRFLTPLAATKLFYDTYRCHLIGYLETHKDKALAASVSEIPFDEFTKDLAYLTKAWTARQHADVFGAPYNLYIEYCMWFWSRRAGGGRRYAPQINQLGFNERSETAWTIEFKKFMEDRLALEARSLANVPQLHPAAFMGTSEQIATRDFLLDLSKKSDRSWADNIEKWCYSYPVLTPESFASVVDAQTLNAELEKTCWIERKPSPAPDPLPPEAFWPSCHGMPNAHSLVEPTCATCKFSASCSKLASEVVVEVQEATGHKEPRKVQLRAPANARQAKYRARKKAETATGSPCRSAPIGKPTDTPGKLFG